MNDNVLAELYAVVCDRKQQYLTGGITDADVMKQKSYTCYLFAKGVDKICKKCGEECTEMVIAAKNQDPDELKNEIADLLYHVMVLCAQLDLPFSAVEEVLRERSQKIGNLKQLKQVDHET